MTPQDDTLRSGGWVKDAHGVYACGGHDGSSTRGGRRGANEDWELWPQWRQRGGSRNPDQWMMWWGELWRWGDSVSGGEWERAPRGGQQQLWGGTCASSYGACGSSRETPRDLA